MLRGERGLSEPVFQQKDKVHKMKGDGDVAEERVIYVSYSIEDLRTEQLTGYHLFYKM